MDHDACHGDIRNGGHGGSLLFTEDASGIVVKIIFMAKDVCHFDWEVKSSVRHFHEKMAPAEGVEPPLAILETAVLSLNDADEGNSVPKCPNGRSGQREKVIRPSASNHRKREEGAPGASYLPS